VKAYRTFLNISHGQCRFVIGEPCGPDTLYCGDPTLPRKSWCAAHAKRLFIAETRAERERWIAETASLSDESNRG
jgi:hypothetical protein